jgi:hypothetical protein
MGSFLNIFFVLNIIADPGAVGAAAASLYISGYIKMMQLLAASLPFR